MMRAIPAKINLPKQTNCLNFISPVRKYHVDTKLEHIQKSYA
jgi:hypothetical protein